MINITYFIFSTQTYLYIHTLDEYCTHTYTSFLDAEYLGINQILRDNARVWYDWSYIVAWCGVGLSLLSAILFSSAAICLRGEREREEALNMQYLMPGKQLFHHYYHFTGKVSFYYYSI